MSVTLTFSSSNGGASLTSPLDHGDSSNGAETGAQEIFLRHDGVNNITGVSLFGRAYSEPYSGSATALADFNELIGWGDKAYVSAPDFGGVQFNFAATTSYPDGSWSVWNAPDPSGGATIRGGVGDSEGSAIVLPTSTGAVLDGIIQPGMSPNVRFKMRVQVPESENVVGIRQFDTVISYVYTS